MTSSPSAASDSNSTDFGEMLNQIRETNETSGSFSTSEEEANETDPPSDESTLPNKPALPDVFALPGEASQSGPRSMFDFV